jgi:hypothetical protein
MLQTACGAAPGPHGPNAPTDYNVVLVTLDGVRWQEFFGGMDPLLAPNASPEPLFAHFRRRLAPRGALYGNPAANSEMNTSNLANASLAGYTSIFAEVEQGCATNFCAQIAVPTFLDRLRDELQIPREDLAVFATWPKVALAVTGRGDVAEVRVGSDMPPWGHQLMDVTFEMDRGTVAHGFEYLIQHSPRFFYLALLDSDRYGHQGNYPLYAEVLRAYDRLLVKLLDRIDAGGRKTALIITTDHGRGLWDQWTEHGPHTPAAARVWAFVMLPTDAAELALEAPDARAFNHHDVRYTIEALFGLSAPSTGFIRR